MPSALLPKYAMDIIDDWSDEASHRDMGFIVDDHEFEATMKYLKHVKKIPTRRINSWASGEGVNIEIKGECRNCEGTGFVGDGMHACYPCHRCNQ